MIKRGNKIKIKNYIWIIIIFIGIIGLIYLFATSKTEIGRQEKEWEWIEEEILLNGRRYIAGCYIPREREMIFSYEGLKNGEINKWIE